MEKYVYVYGKNWKTPGFFLLYRTKTNYCDTKTETKKWSRDHVGFETLTSLLSTDCSDWLVNYGIHKQLFNSAVW